MSARSFTRTYGIKCVILPTPRQITFLQKNFGCARKIYNLLVEEGNQRDTEAVAWHNEDPEGRADKTYPHKWTTEAEFKKQYPYLKEADSLGLVAAREHYHEARNRHYDGAGRPKFKSKWDYPRTYTTKNQGYQDDPNKGTIRVYKRGSKWWLHVPKLPKNTVRAIDEDTGKPGKKTHKEDDDIQIILPKKITDQMRIHSVTLGQSADGSYYASLSVKETITADDPEEKEERDYQLLASLCYGGDLGLKNYLTGTDGINYDDPADYKKLEERHRREQKKLGKQQARLKKQGKRLSECCNYQRQKRKVAKIAARIARKREDFRHKLSRQLVDSFDLIALEDLHVVGMLKNRHLARVVSESAWSDFIHKVLYKAEWEGKTVVLVSQWFPSTRTCSCCGAKSGPHGAGDLGVREWVCPECGAHLDRDANASWNILLEGLRIAASGEDEMALVWGQVYELVLAQHKESFEPNGRVVTAPTVGTAGVAWVEDSGVGSPMLGSYPGVYTEPAVVTSGCFGSGLGEPGVSKKSQGNCEQADSLPSGKQPQASK